MAGRPPKPTRLKVIQGNPGKRRLPVGEPTPRMGAPSMPRWLSKDARREWRYIVRELQAMGLLAKPDRALLAAYCECVAEYVACMKDVQEHGLYYETEKGYQGPRPALSHSVKMVEKLMQLSARFGLSPSDRAKLAAPQVHEADPFAEFLAKARKTGTDGAGEDE